MEIQIIKQYKITRDDLRDSIITDWGKNPEERSKFDIRFDRVENIINSQVNLNEFSETGSITEIGNNLERKTISFDLTYSDEWKETVIKLNRVEEVDAGHFSSCISEMLDEFKKRQ